MLKACLNGNRRRPEHPALPVTAGELATDAAAASDAGADAVHLHVKDADGNDTLDAAALASVMPAVTEAAPGLPIGVTTGAWAVQDPDARIAAVRSWAPLTVLPDFASVNWHEDGADDVAAALLDIGVAVEAGLWHVVAAEAWLRSPHRDHCLRVLLELPENLRTGDVEAEADQLLKAIEAATNQNRGIDILLHGEGSSAWPAVNVAGRLGLSTRIGLEDVLHLPDGSATPGNAALVQAARSMVNRSVAR